MAMGCQQCLTLSAVQLNGKHCQKTHCCNGVVDTFRLLFLVTFPRKRSNLFGCHFPVELAISELNNYFGPRLVRTTVSAKSLNGTL